MYPMQIALEKRDMCFSPLGESLFGYTTDEDESLNCECSRKRWELDNALRNNAGVADTDVPLYMQ